MVLDSNIIQRRIFVIGISVLFLIGIIVVRLLFLQVLTGSEYLKIAKENKIRTVYLEAPRGSIYDRNGHVLVGNRPALTALLNMPQGELTLEEETEIDEVVKRLSEVLSMPVFEIKEKLDNPHISPYRPIPIKEDISQETAVYIKEHQLDFSRVVIEGQAIREYPNGMLGAHILGYIGEISEEELETDKYKKYSLGDAIGRDGVESTYEIDLSGKKGEKRIEVNAEGYPVSTIVTKEAESGKSIYLTIDKDLQALSEDLLEEALEQARQAYDSETKEYYKAPAGAIVVMNPKNGEVLAMASYPSYDPRLFTDGIPPDEWEALNDPQNHYPLNNRAVNNSYPPGSTIKVVTATAAMIEEVAGSDSEFNCTGKWTGAGQEWPQFCWLRTGHGELSLREGIVESCDTVFYEIGLSFYRMIDEKGEKMQEWLTKFGLGSPTGIDLPGEDGGRIPTKEWKKEWNEDNPEYQIWYPGDSTNMAIGQGDLLATPLQMANVYCAIANGGVIYKPHIVKKIESNDKKIIKDVGAEKVNDLNISPYILSVLRESLEEVVESGTAKSAFIGFPLEDVRIAGKTGSAEMYGRQANAWFAAYAPADDPQYVVLVVIEEGGAGVKAAAPVARKIIESIYGIESTSDIRVETTVED